MLGERLSLVRAAEVAKKPLTNDGEEATGNGSAGNETENDDSQKGPRVLRGGPGDGTLGFGRHCDGG